MKIVNFLQKSYSLSNLETFIHVMFIILFPGNMSNFGLKTWVKFSPAIRRIARKSLGPRSWFVDFLISIPPFLCCWNFYLQYAFVLYTFHYTFQLKITNFWISLEIFNFENFTHVFKPKLLIFPGNRIINITGMKVSKFDKEYDFWRKITIFMLFYKFCWVFC